jgi:hypothetical protein
VSIRDFLTTALLLVASAHSTPSAPEVYSGEPLVEALYDLATTATPLAHELSSASPLFRTDVYRLRDGRLVAITSRAKRLGEPYSVETLRVTPSPSAKLTKQLPTVSAVRLPK